MARLLSVAVLLLLLAVPSAEAKPRLKVKGGERTTITNCTGKQRKARAIGVAGIGRIVVRGNKRLRVAECVDGKFRRASASRGGRRLPTGEDADLRLKANGRTRFVRVGQGPVVDFPVAFEVTNGNGTSVSCPVDNKTYTIRGHITGPAAALEDGGPGATTLYAHGHSFSEDLWRYDGVDGYDFVGELAEDGHVSVTYDRLGYESSDKPFGEASCYASEATVADELLRDLKAGDYTAEGREPLTFQRVALAGHSQAAIFSGLAVATFGTADALLHLSFFESGITEKLALKYRKNLEDCAANPQTANQEPSTPSGYGFRGATDEDFQSTNFVDADPQVVADFTAMRNVDPCGFPYTAVETVSQTNPLNRTIDVPVLVVFGESDPNFAPGAAVFQSQIFSGSPDVTAEQIGGAGHALMLERAAPAFQTVVSRWLSARGF